ncbi:MAG: hypothetical protein WB952_07165 [Terriglobales bacterium]
MRTRPVGVTIFALLMGLNTALFIVLVALAIFSRSSLTIFLHALSPSGAGPEAMHTSMGGLLPLYYTVMAGVTAALAMGFWRLRNWARIVTLGITALSLALMVTEVRPLLTAPTAGAISITLLRLALSVLWLWYLLRRPVRDAFHQPLS